mmetsp:Transcript_25284/g.35237  ORF Transcript_25284/g.35237 Transcript_25284/m.35237 type:complete len:83 (+) Transcript_25284:1191-1439(+)
MDGLPLDAVELGALVGALEAVMDEGVKLGLAEGVRLGIDVGVAVGSDEGVIVGFSVGATNVGLPVPSIGFAVGFALGFVLGI